jgi:hypothetical protein
MHHKTLLMRAVLPARSVKAAIQARAAELQPQLERQMAELQSVLDSFQMEVSELSAPLPFGSP